MTNCLSILKNLVTIIKKCNSNSRYEKYNLKYIEQNLKRITVFTIENRKNII
jgi:hypothetical protein